MSSAADYRQRSLDSKHTRSHRYHRSRSPRERNDQDRSSRRSKRASTAVTLPLNAAPISKYDLKKYRPMFGLYLDVQKQLYIEDLGEDEVKGRWKSFVGKWNRGELAEGWYDPVTFQKAIAAAAESHKEYSRNEQASRAYSDNEVNDRDRDESQKANVSGDVDEEEEDDYGPAPPQELAMSASQRNTTQSLRDYDRQGPSIPSLQDLQARNEQMSEDARAERTHQISDLRASRKADLRTQKAHLDDLTPRAEAGTRERQLENKRLKADANRGFAAAAHDTGTVELKDSEVMGDEDSLSELKSMKKENERKKNEREIRREEALRARMVEREEKLRGIRQKEEKTMDMLKKIAQARFGGAQ